MALKDPIAMAMAIKNNPEQATTIAGVGSPFECTSAEADMPIARPIIMDAINTATIKSVFLIAVGLID